MSLNALNTMAVEDMDSIPPRKIQLVCEKPIALPAVYPRNIMPQTMITVENMAEAPTLISFLNEKSSPMANRRKITPISAHILILAWSETVGNREMEGPAIIPATIYPTMTGCPSHLKMTVMIPAIIKIVARSDIKGATSDIGVTFYMDNSLRTRIRFLSMGLSFLIALLNGT